MCRDVEALEKELQEVGEGKKKGKNSVFVNEARK
jgi:hypothetical protein